MALAGGSSSTRPPPTSSTSASARSSGAVWPRCPFSMGADDVGPSCPVVMHRGDLLHRVVLWVMLAMSSGWCWISRPTYRAEDMLFQHGLQVECQRLDLLKLFGARLQMKGAEFQVPSSNSRFTSSFGISPAEQDTQEFAFLVASSDTKP